MLLVAVLGLTSFQLVTAYVHHVERRGTVCELPDGSTRTVGEKFTIGESKCIKYECLQDGSAPYYYAGCQKPDGVCVDVNQTYNDGCSVKTCMFTNGTLAFVGDGCSDTELGVCKSEAEVWQVKRRLNEKQDYGQCITKQCLPGGANNITKTQCLFKNTCFDIGQFALNEEKCEKIECVYDAGEHNFIMMPITMCTAQNSTHSWCVDIGSEGFPRIINGVHYHDCMCSKNGNGLSYQCYLLE
ncbi:uncharacterized protein LOC135475918 [Liolophura sinensis]|uniref:uncharacterized protein LOC135475918 n=1 Tax=Liolophura sinensis TaxID=3198878 RepID=UPI003157FC1D